MSRWLAHVLRTQLVMIPIVFLVGLVVIGPCRHGDAPIPFTIVVFAWLGFTVKSMLVGDLTKKPSYEELLEGLDEAPRVEQAPAVDDRA